jgi:hypothetical protein
MKTAFYRSLLFLLSLLLAAVPYLSAQGNGVNARSNGKAADDTLPFAVGEVLAYEGKISKIISGISVADLTFTVSAAPEMGDYLVQAEARSKGTLLKLFRFSFRQEVSTTIDGERFRALRTVKKDVQKDRVRDSEAIFDYEEKRVTYVETDPKQPMRPPRKIASHIEEETHDLISAIYALRTLPLGVGRIFEMNISDTGLVYNIPVKVTGRERVKSIFGKVWCFRVEPQVFGPGRLIEREGRMVIWVMDDARRLPLKSEIHTEYGKIDIRLRTASKAK